MKNMKKALMKLQHTTPDVKKYHHDLKPPILPPGVIPRGVTAPVMAMDYSPGFNPYQYGIGDSVSLVSGFPGYPYLAMLSTRPEYRSFAGSFSTELTREWIKLTGKDDNADKIKIIDNEMKRLDVRGVFQRVMEHDCYFGRGQIFVDIRGADRQTPLSLSPKTVAKGSLLRLTPVEAMWTTPLAYNATDPTAPDFYKPKGWWMLGQQIHASRLPTIMTRPLPDILKPAFNFSGISLSQLAEPYVDNWIRTRQSVSDLINNFSITILATSMEQVLQGDDEGDDLNTRVDLFNATKSNRGMMVVDKDREEIVQVNTPLSGLSELQSQSQEHLCAVARTPAVILTGISPTGLNASSEGEIRVFYDWIAAQQNAHIRDPLEVILKLMQLSLFGEIDPDIGFEFVPLYQQTPKELSDIREADARTAQTYVDMGAVSPEEVRENLAKDPDSGYSGLDLAVTIDPPMSEEPPDGL